MYWRLRTAAMFAAMTLILVVIGGLVGYLFKNWMIGMAVMLVISIAFNFYAYFFSKGMALRANKVQLVTREQEPRLYGIVEGIALKAGLPMPEVGISNVPMPNAFATGRNPKNAAVVATRPLLSLLTDDELEGVMAHEMSHVKNRDILVMSVASTMASLVAYVTRVAVWSSMFSNDENNGLSLVIALIADITLPIAAMLVQLGVSRNREYLADESGARITGKPMALASALTKIESGCTTKANNYDNPSYESVWISSPFGMKKARGLVNLFRTHPTTPDRIARLKALDEEINGIKHL
ncbi:zinc metalloprotease HtpX [Candidatus Methanoprimaticola sp. MG2]|uniref:zinc metalloprotease HtpX n=1 Tax=Candidatus Methanoprimaticola sp. MG2 TaxID=3228838 RepID=UPI0039C61E90